MSTEAKCSCQYCNAHIAFPAEMAGQMFACPHCGLETKLFIPNIAKVPANKPPQNVSVEIKRGVSPLGIASLVLGIIACVICWVPILGLFAIPVALIGLVLAFIGVVMAAMNKKTGFVFSISGGIVCILSMCIALVSTGAVAKLYSDSKKSNQTPVSTTAETSNQRSVSSSPAVTSGLVAPSNSEWTQSRSVKQGDIQIEITGAYVGPIYVSDTGNISDEYYLKIDITIRNTSSTKKADFHTWRGGLFGSSDSAILTDNNGNTYKSIAVLPVLSYQKTESSVYPNTQNTGDALVFEKPVNNIQWLHLELPAGNFGGSGMIRFEIPASKIVYQ